MTNIIYILLKETEINIVEIIRRELIGMSRAPTDEEIAHNLEQYVNHLQEWINGLKENKIQGRSDIRSLCTLFAGIEDDKQKEELLIDLK
jgi:ABC-type transport system involved in cytochrome bd biosynthesis fused ATPase/permease subunit